LGLNLPVIGDDLQIGHISFTIKGDLSPFKKKRSIQRFSKKKKKIAKQASLAFKAYVRGLIFNGRGMLGT
jgi:hypothetical protein